MDLTFDGAHARRNAEFVHRLSQDFRRLESRIAPTLEDRRDAPLIEDWELTYRLDLALTGLIAGQNGPKGLRVTSSMLFLLDEGLGCARTLDRWYRLGGKRA